MNRLCFTRGLRTGFARGNTVEYALDQSYKIGSLRQLYSMSSHAEIIRSDALNSLLNEKVSGSAKIDILGFFDLNISNNVCYNLLIK